MIFAAKGLCRNPILQGIRTPIEENQERPDTAAEEVRVKTAFLHCFVCHLRKDRLFEIVSQK